ncbi:uncharacterized protein isoform X2 [Leptinotarsa decemlineata]|uniref:uncharacterized protein isoform X2 n=1 Tax=Leptinotarsa decemlineata TaxID=7539 RepID=UPI003D30A585
MDLNKINGISLVDTENKKPVEKLQNLPLGEPQKIFSARIVQTKFGKTVLLELEKHITFLPQRVTKTYERFINHFEQEKYAIVFRGLINTGKANCRKLR